jgi:hypothetical protein
MRFINRLLPFIPLSVQLALVAATLEHLPPRLGQTADVTGTDTWICLAAWVAVVATCNGAFVFLHIRMPKFKDTMLSAPGHVYWLATPERRADFVQKLRSIAETALFGLNLFFLAVYQSVYQANALRPVVQFPMTVLFVGFMVAPLLLVVVHISLTIHRLAAEARDKAQV